MKFLAAVAAAAAAAIVIVRRQQAAADAEADLWAEATDPVDAVDNESDDEDPRA